MLKKVMCSMLTFLALCAGLSPAHAMSIVVDARVGAMIEPPNPITESGSGCSMGPASNQPTVTLFPGTVSAISFPVDLPSQMIKNTTCQEQGKNLWRYTFIYRIKSLSGYLLATVRTTVLVTRKNSPDGWIPKSIQYEHTVTRQNEFEGTVIVGCNAPYDPACMMPTAKNPPLLPDEYQWDVANQTTWRYFPFSVMIRVEGAE